MLSGLGSILTNLVFILALLLFLTAESGGTSRRMNMIGSERPHMIDALQGFVHGTRSYLVVTAVFGLIVAVLDSTALAIMGVPLVVLWGVLAFITNFIPNIGFVIGLVPPALVALLTGGWQLALAVVVVYCVLNMVMQSLIQPRFVGDSVGLSATATFVALLFWAWVLGPLGALLAIPVTLLIKAVLVDSDPRTRWVEALLGSEPTPPKDNKRAKKHLDFRSFWPVATVSGLAAGAGVEDEGVIDALFGVPVWGRRTWVVLPRCSARRWRGRSRWPSGRLILGSAVAGSAGVAGGRVGGPRRSRTVRGGSRPVRRGGASPAGRGL